MKLLFQTREQLFTQSKNRFFVNVCALLILLAAAYGVYGQSVNFVWDAVSGVSGYKLYQGGASGAYTNSIDVGSATQTTVSGLVPGQTYYFAATAYNSSGVQSDYSGEVAYTVPSGRPPPENPLTFTADSGVITAPFVLLNGILSQNLLSTLLGGGEAVYNFTIDIPGSYVVSAMVNAPSDWENSLYINIDGEPTDPLMVWDVPVTSGFTNLTASWRGNATSGPPQYAPKVFNLTAGPHQLYVRGREPDTQLQSFTISPVNAVMKLTMLSGRTSNVTGLGTPGHVYEVQASPDLTTWTVLGNVTADSSGAFSYTDNMALFFANRFYRLRDTTP